jgi:hypothetical protein
MLAAINVTAANNLENAKSLDLRTILVKIHKALCRGHRQDAVLFIHRSAQNIRFIRKMEFDCLQHDGPILVALRDTRDRLVGHGFDNPQLARV